MQGGGFKRRHLYQSGKGVSFFLTKPSSKTSKTGQWRFCPLDSRGGRVLLKKGDTLSALVQMTPLNPSPSSASENTPFSRRILLNPTLTGYPRDGAPGPG